MQLEHVRSDFDLRSIARLIWRRKLAIVVSMAVLVGGQLLISFRQSPTYQASAQILVTPQSNIFSSNAAATDPTRALQNEALIITSVQIRGAVQLAFGLLFLVVVCLSV